MTGNGKPKVNHSPGGISEINVTMKDMKCAVTLVPFSFNSPTWPLQKTDGFWRMWVDYHKLNQVITSTAAAGTRVVDCMSTFTHSLMLSMQPHSGKCLPPYTCLYDLPKAGGFQPGLQYTLTALLPENINSAAPRLNLMWGLLIVLPQNITRMY